MNPEAIPTVTGISIMVSFSMMFIYSMYKTGKEDLQRNKDILNKSNADKNYEQLFQQQEREICRLVKIIDSLTNTIK